MDQHEGHTDQWDPDSPPAEATPEPDEFAKPGYDPSDTIRQREARRRRVLLDGYGDLVRLLDVAERVARKLDVMPDRLSTYRNDVMGKLVQLSAQDAYPIHSRQRPPAQMHPQVAARRPGALVFVDECGHNRMHDRNFPYFAVAAAVIPEEEYADVEERWRSWRREWLADPNRPTHEPGFRRGSLRHLLKPGRVEGAAQASLNRLLLDLPVHLVAAVLDHRAYRTVYGDALVDEFLPRDAYLMCFTFAMERVVHLLYHGLGDRRGRVLADPREQRENALVQQEYQRLKIDGTLFVADTWFRYNLGPSIRFSPRSDDEVGLQIADLLARPVADRYADPSVAPLRWDVVKAKLYGGGVDTRPAYGLKIFPGDHERLKQMLQE